MKKTITLLLLLYAATTVMAQNNNDSISFTNITTTDFMEAIGGGTIQWKNLQREQARPRWCILGIMILSGIKLNAQPPVTDTLQWLKTNIEQRKNLFINKPLRVLLDSLKDLKSGVVEYSGPSWYAIGNLNDTIKVRSIKLYFEEVIGSEKFWMHHDIFFANNGVDTLNTHIKFITIKFIQPILFLRDWWSYNSDNLGSNEWLPKVEALYKNAIVKDIKVGEY